MISQVILPEPQETPDGALGFAMMGLRVVLWAVPCVLLLAVLVKEFRQNNVFQKKQQRG